MTKAYFTDTLRSIRRSVGRFISMMLIVFLGAGVFCGFKATYPDMLATADKYYKDNNLFDIRVQSFIGIYDGDLDEIEVHCRLGQKDKRFRGEAVAADRARHAHRRAGAMFRSRDLNRRLFASLLRCRNVHSLGRRRPNRFPNSFACARYV